MHDMCVRDLYSVDRERYRIYFSSNGFKMQSQMIAIHLIMNTRIFGRYDMNKKLILGFALALVLVSGAFVGAQASRMSSSLQLAFMLIMQPPGDR